MHKCERMTVYTSRVLVLLENIFLAMIMANSDVQMISRATETRVETAFLYVWVVAVSTFIDVQSRLKGLAKLGTSQVLSRSLKPSPLTCVLAL